MAGYSEATATVQASRLLTHPRVQKAVNWLGMHLTKALSIDVPSLVAELSELKELCIQAKEYGNAIKAVEIKGRSIGAWVDRHQIETFDWQSFNQLTTNPPNMLETEQNSNNQPKTINHSDIEATQGPTGEDYQGEGAETRGKTRPFEVSS